MAWVKGIREVRHELVPTLPEVEGLRKGPVLRETRRVIVDLPGEAIARTVTPVALELPLTVGAGPCGTYARQPFRTRMLWSVVHLIGPLQTYYATYVPPLYFGAKSGPRGRRAA